jgi:23S rRNA (adenine2503-C2)-methyltransferase
MLNYDNVKKAINFITDQKKLDLSNRRITVSTCGIVPKIKEFTNDFSQISLAISLHAPNSKIRKQLMPIEKTYPLKDLMKSLDDHVNKINRKIFYEYTMIE